MEEHKQDKTRDCRNQKRCKIHRHIHTTLHFVLIQEQAVTNRRVFRHVKHRKVGTSPTANEAQNEVQKSIEEIIIELIKENKIGGLAYFNKFKKV